MQEYRVYVDHLRIGAYIRLELSWFEHPFLSGSFKIKNQAQIATLKKLGVETVLLIPGKSDAVPQPQSASSGGNPSDTTPHGPQTQDDVSCEALWRVKEQRIKLLKAQRERIQRCEKEFQQALEGVKSIMANLETASQQIVDQGNKLIAEIVQTLVGDKDVVVHLINTEENTENLLYHSLNTAVLGLLMGREYGLEAEALQQLGLGLLFHDIGKQRIPKKVLLKKTPLTQSEQKLIELHPQYGAEIIAERAPDFSPEALEIVTKHHETADGGGYPEGLTADQIPLLVKLACAVNVYDNYCNKSDPKLAMTPYQALSYMFHNQNGAMERKIVAVLVRCLGVYPPGSIVHLSNGSIGLVVSVNSADSLRPDVLLYDPDVPKNEALAIPLLDEPDLTIVKNIHPASLQPEIYEYLNPRARVIHFTEPITSPNP